ncbi:DUF3291 domain-containing protein [Acanthopleuribacter pedis]|uniref:DUF3291 domain-containing protein n=1 Tax=Acanthopleuribacter pedis TaxID=442870 RepID=A0A8J7U640_9BACT|nr:DUF3291 domain-containing protein [Acanthopleuribacter pedis]MBO1322367.1 DUF3291 domain-containing protein [Acanthopleuribacter pedis]
MREYHLAQYNIARALYPLDDERMHGFMSQLDAVNALAEAAPGFVWRLKSDSGNSTDIQLYEDARIVVNMSVWTDPDTLFEYTYHSDHVKVFADRHQWFERRTKQASLVLWWHPADETPSGEEGKKRLAYLQEHGPSPHAFTLKKRFDKPS